LGEQGHAKLFDHPAVVQEFWIVDFPLAVLFRTEQVTLPKRRDDRMALLIANQTAGGEFVQAELHRPEIPGILPKPGPSCVGQKAILDEVNQLLAEILHGVFMSRKELAFQGQFDGVVVFHHGLDELGHFLHCYADAVFRQGDELFIFGLLARDLVFGKQGTVGDALGELGAEAACAAGKCCRIQQNLIEARQVIHLRFEVLLHLQDEQPPDALADEGGGLFGRVGQL
jgi:hypothetical protein